MIFFRKISLVVFALTWAGVAQQATALSLRCQEQRISALGTVKGITSASDALGAISQHSDGGGEEAPKISSRRSFFSKAATATASAWMISTPSSAWAEDAPVFEGIATWAYRQSTVERRLGRANLAGTIIRYEDRLEAPPSLSKQSKVYVSLEFPADWLELDKMNQGIQYVDQRNGDKLYVFSVPLPPNTSLMSVPKAYFATSLFNPQSSLVLSGNAIEDYRVTSSRELTDGAVTQFPRRRMLTKYATVTGNGFRVERRALLDAYQVNDVAYVLMTSSNAVKFDAKGMERDTVESIADSFRIQVV